MLYTNQHFLGSFFVYVLAQYFINIYNIVLRNLYASRLTTITIAISCLLNRFVFMLFPPPLHNYSRSSLAKQDICQPTTSKKGVRRNSCKNRQNIVDPLPSNHTVPHNTASQPRDDQKQASTSSASFFFAIYKVFSSFLSNIRFVKLQRVVS